MTLKSGEELSTLQRMAIIGGGGGGGEGYKIGRRNLWMAPNTSHNTQYKSTELNKQQTTCHDLFPHFSSTQ